MQTSSDGGRVRRPMVGAVAGVVAAGLAFGLVAGVTGTIGADGPSPSRASVETARQPAEPADPADPATPDRAERSRARLVEVLQPLVDDGTLTGAQLDAVVDRLVEHRLDHRRQRGADLIPDRRWAWPWPGLDGEVVAGILGIGVDELRSALRDGSSISDVAESVGVDVRVVVDALVDELRAHLDLAVEYGRLTPDEATQRLEQLAERIATMVERTRPSRR